jgi:hypothetical protein
MRSERQPDRHEANCRFFAFLRTCLKTAHFSIILLYFTLIFFFVVAVCSENSCLSLKYHVGLWNGKRWTCCRISNRSTDGCESCTPWSRTPPTLGSFGLIKNDSVELITNTAAAGRLTGMTLLGLSLR